MKRLHRSPERLFRRARGFSIVEILIAVMIIAILTTILVPVLSKRTEQARLAACDSDLQRLADAEDRVATELGYYLRLYALDDTARGDGIGSRNVNDRLDGITDERIDGNTIDMFIRIADHDLLTVAQATPLYTSLLGYDSTPASAEMQNFAPEWNGPYCTIQSDETYEEYQDLNDPLHVIDIPNDPWGNDYILVMPGDSTTNGGYVREPAGTIEPIISANGASGSARQFGRPAIVSLGPNGQPGDGSGAGTDSDLGAGDDRTFEFGY